MTLKNMIVTGGAGFIGNSFVAQAVAKGHNVIVLDALTYAGHIENLDWIKGKNYPGKLELVVGNICDGALISKLLEQHSIDAVVNFAAESHVDNSISKPGEFIETNIIGTYTMLEASRAYWNGLKGEKKEAFRFLQVSTDEVYGSLGPTGKFTEETRMKPNSPYSASKAAGDHLVRAWFKTYGLPTVCTNCTNNYGPRQHPEKLIPRMITNALSEQALPIYGDGKNVRDWIYVDDHCAGVYLALTKGVPGQTYCFGGDAEKNNNDVVNTLCEVLDKVAPRKGGKSYKELIQYVPDRPGHDQRYAIDDSKAQRDLGFTRSHTFEQGIRDTIQWYIDNTDWCSAILGKKAA